MLKSLTLTDFKSFRRATLPLGPLTLIVGSNGTGKTNTGEAFRFLHGVARGFSLAKILGEAETNGTAPWRGIRGGAAEAAHGGAASFAIEASFQVRDNVATYRIEVDPGRGGRPPRVLHESLHVGMERIFDAQMAQVPSSDSGAAPYTIQLPDDRADFEYWVVMELPCHRPLLPQLAHQEALKPAVRAAAQRALAAIPPMRFYEFGREVLAAASDPGRTVLGERGENLSSVLDAVCRDVDRKAAILRGLKALVPEPIQDLEFRRATTGGTLVHLVEAGGRSVPAPNASEGALRALALLVALLVPQTARFYFIEEIDRGIATSRLQFLIQLIVERCAADRMRVVATTRSPKLLTCLSPRTLEHAVLAYRPPALAETHLCRVFDLPEVKDALSRQGVSSVYAAGWLERVLEPLSR